MATEEADAAESGDDDYVRTTVLITLGWLAAMAVASGLLWFFGDALMDVFA